MRRFVGSGVRLQARLIAVQGCAAHCKGGVVGGALVKSTVGDLDVCEPPVVSASCRVFVLLPQGQAAVSTDFLAAALGLEF